MEKAGASKIVVITGLSGAGRTEAMHAFEDLGYYVSDNVPPKLIAQLAHTIGVSQNAERHLAVVCDLRSQGLFDELLDIVSELNASALTTELLFLDCSDAELKQRYAFSRRKNPIAKHGESTEEAIARERALLAQVRDGAAYIIDTSHLNPHELNKKITEHYAHNTSPTRFEVNVFSFGFRYAQPRDANMVVDVRFLPNPYWEDSLRELSGLDAPIQDYVLSAPVTTEFLKRWFALLETTLEASKASGALSFVIGIGCTGGKHRSVVISEKTAEWCSSHGYDVSLKHTQLKKKA